MTMLSVSMSAAYNAVNRGKKIVSVQSPPEGGAVTITLNGKRSPSADRLVREIGLKEAWKFFVRDCGAAYSAIADRVLMQGGYEGFAI